MTKNIGIDARFYGSLGKGLGRYTQKLIEHLETIDTANIYYIFLRKENFNDFHPKNSNFKKVLADYQWYSFSEQIVFPLLLYRYRLDMMHFPHFNIPILYWKPFVVTIHDLILIHYPTARASTLPPIWYKFKFGAYKFTIWWAIQRSSHILTVSEYTKQDILQHYSVFDSKITVTHEAIDMFCWHHSVEQSARILQKYDLLETGQIRALSVSSLCDILKPYLLYVGNAYPHKNLEALITLLTEDTMKDVQLVIVGKEDYFYRKLKRKVQKYAMANVRFVGYVPDNDLDVLYRYGRAYVFPSLYEGFGLPPLEALGRGLPVLASRITSLPEVLGDAAHYFDPHSGISMSNSIRDIWHSKDLREDMRRKGYVQIQGFRWETMAKATFDCYMLLFLR